MKRYLISNLLCLLCLTTVSQVRLPRLISDNMVLQRNSELKIWGWASKGEKITVQFLNQIKSAVSNENGEWQVKLAPVPAGGPYTMKIRGSNERTISNILIGDVWVCSGQSNMELPMSRVNEKYRAEIAASANSHIRQFDIATQYHFNGPLNDYVSGSWTEADPTTLLRFTAVGYFFAKALHERYKVPIGIIRSAVGGSPAEAWLSEEALMAYPHYLSLLEQYKDSSVVQRTIQRDNAAIADWNAALDKLDKGLTGEIKWYDENLDTRTWDRFSVPGFWDEDRVFRLRRAAEDSEGMARNRTSGVVWFRKEIDVPASMTGVPAMLRLGTLVDRDITYLNGQQVGTTGYQYPPRRYTVPAGVLRKGKNTIIIRLTGTGSVAGFVPDKKYALEAGGQEISLSGEWCYKIGHITEPMPNTGVTFHYQPGGLYNAMIAPMLNYSIKGVIWYQGESNVSKPEEYKTLFPDVIRNWRAKWQRPDLPFLFVQLASFLLPNKEPMESNWAALREAQRQTLALPHTGMAVTIDIGEWNDIHPLNKKDVGERLARAAFRIAYGEKNIVTSGPLIQKAEKKGKEIILGFSELGSGLVARGDSVLHGFSISGADGKFRWANAFIRGNKVIVDAGDIENPVKLRYAWADNPVSANLYNREGLPASPFEIYLDQ